MLELRRLAPSDLEAVARLHALSWCDSYRGILADAFLDGEVFAERLEHWRGRLGLPLPGQLGLLALRDGEPAGFLYAEGEADPRWGTLLDNLHVAPEQRGQGVGTRLLHALAGELARLWPERPLHLWCYELNRRARHYYEELGALPVERQLTLGAGGVTLASWRYVWTDPGALQAATAPSGQ